MIYKRLILAVVVVTLAGVAFTAAHPASDGNNSPRQAGMSNGMPMHSDERMNPLHRHIMSVFILPEMQSELGLSNQQTAELRRLKQDLLVKAKDLGGQTAARRKELDALLTGDTSRTRAVKALFEKIGDLRAQLQYAGFETAGKMKALLNESQRTKFDAMKPEEVHRLMMSRANMGEMEETMQLMAAEGMGMQNGMGIHGNMSQGMGSGMMQGHAETTHDATPPSATPSDPHSSHHDSH